MGAKTKEFEERRQQPHRNSDRDSLTLFTIYQKNRASPLTRSFADPTFRAPLLRLLGLLCFLEILFCQVALIPFIFHQPYSPQISIPP
jgi:hypothetical protein